MNEIANYSQELEIPGMVVLLILIRNPFFFGMPI
jgi:hypothetical protein